MKLSLVDWLEEHRANAIRISRQKTGFNQAGWLEDAEYFERARVAADCHTLHPASAWTEADGAVLWWDARVCPAVATCVGEMGWAQCRYIVSHWSRIPKVEIPR